MIERINKMIERIKSKEVYTLRVIQTNWMFIRDSNEYKPFISLLYNDLKIFS